MRTVLAVVAISVLWALVIWVNLPREYARGRLDTIRTVTATLPTHTPLPTVTPTPPPTFTPEPLGPKTLRTVDYWRNTRGEVAVFKDDKDGPRYVVRAEYL